MADTASGMNGLEQGRAKFAYDCALKGSEISKKKEYKAYSKKLLALIKTNGLGATFAFINAKSNKNKHKTGYAYKLIYDQTATWLRKDEKNLIVLKKDEDLVEKIITLDSAHYRAVTNEVLAFFRWVSRFADGLIEEEGETEE